ncbi:MAG: hypothetical protein ABH846_03955 [Patescibacteria group bacterium]
MNIEKMGRSFSPESENEVKKPAKLEKEVDIETLINQSDREVLERGLNKLAEILKDKADEDLPKVFIFPDTSARPLVYAVKPVINELYEQRGLPKPDFQFFAVYRQDELYYEATREEYDKTLEENTARLKEIKKNAKLDSGDSVLFIEDYLSLGRTSMIMDELLEKADYQNKGIRDERFAFFVASSNPKWKYGTSIQDTGFDKYGGFEYRGWGNSETSIGVNKQIGERYVKKSDIVEPAKMRALRGEMKQIAKEYLEEMQN